MTNELTFKSHTFTPIIINNLPYLGVQQIAVALGYGKRGCQNDTPLRTLYNRHADEFTPDMSFLTTVETAGGKQQVRVFSLRGCHLLAMFSKTPVAKEFRRWVLDLIEQHNAAVREIRTTPVDMKAIGGVVKKCVNKALTDFLNNELPVPDEDDILRQKYYNVSDKDMAETLQRWYWSRNYDVRQALDRSAQRIEELETKLRMVQKALA